MEKCNTQPERLASVFVVCEACVMAWAVVLAETERGEKALCMVCFEELSGGDDLPREAGRYSGAGDSRPEDRKGRYSGPEEPEAVAADRETRPRSPRLSEADGERSAERDG